MANFDLTSSNNGKLSLINHRYFLPPRNSVRQVMASPPTIATSTTNTITGRYWPAANNAASSSAVSGNYFTFTRAANFTTGTAYPNYNAIKPTNVNYGSNGLLANSFSVSFDFTGTAFSIANLDYATTYLMIKVDDQYTTMTPITFSGSTGAGTANFTSVTFGTAGRRRIELIMNLGTNASFGGVWTAAGDVIQPCAIRGARVICFGDSFTEGSLATAGPCSNYPIVFGELMGWDDVWCSGVGGTGFLATNSGTRPTYRQRIGTDIIPFSPDMVIFQPSINDSAYSAQQINTEANFCFALVQQLLPNCLIACLSPVLSTRYASAAAYQIGLRPLLKQSMAQIGGLFIDYMQMPVTSGYPAQTTTLYSQASSGATSIQTTVGLRPYCQYMLPDGTGFLCTAASGGSAPFTATIDNMPATWAAGTTIIEVGDCLWTGTGHVGATAGNGTCDTIVGSDAAHPSQAGHECLAVGAQFNMINFLFSN